MINNRRTRLLIDFIERNPNVKVLDIGNLGDGGGIHEYMVNKLGENNTFGLDILDQKIKNKNYSNQYVGVAEKMPFEDNTFDLVYMGEVVEHTWHPYEMLGEVKRVLKTGGVLILDTPNIYSLSRMLRYILKGGDYILGDPTHKIFYSRAMIENLVESSGFKINRIGTDCKFSIKGKTFYLPNLHPFKFMGEHLLCEAETVK